MKKITITNGVYRKLVMAKGDKTVNSYLADALKSKKLVARVKRDIQTKTS